MTRLEQELGSIGLDGGVSKEDADTLSAAALLDAEDAYRRGVEDSISTIEESATAMGVTCADDQVKVAIVRLERLKDGNGNANG